MKKNTCMDYFVMGVIGIIGLAETAHLAALLLGWTFTYCVILFWGLVGAAVLAAVAGMLFRKERSQKKTLVEEGPHKKEQFLIKEQSPVKELDARKMERAEGILWAVFFIIALSQLVFICIGGQAYRQGDMTVETVESFLAADSLYQVNPMTGLPYMEGIPTRLKILCLPSLYGSLCMMTGLSPATVVCTIVPVAALLGSYAAFGSLGRFLFGKNRACFMVAVSLLMWAGTYLYGMDGFNMLFCGWRGTSIRNGILAPWLMSVCLRKKWWSAILCILAEACIVWTLYGMGVCLVMAVGVAGVQLCCRLYSQYRLRGKEKAK